MWSFSQPARKWRWQTKFRKNLPSEKDLICAIATPTAQAAYSASAGKVPVIYSAVADPAAAKLLDENGKNLPGITGTSDLLPVEKQLQMIRAFLPDAKKIGILYTTSEANSVSQLNLYKQYAPQYGFEIVEKGVGKQADVPLATDALLSQVDCLSNLTDNTVVSALAVILEKASAKKIPVFGSEEEQVANGCLASEGIDYVKLGVQTGVMAAKVLKGEKAEDIPYEIIKEYVFVVNQKTLNDLGLTLTPEQQQRAQLVG